MLLLDTHCVTVDESAKHRHQFYLDSNKNGANSSPGSWFVDAGTIGVVNSENTKGGNRYTEISGGDVPHNNLQMSKAVYIWRRTA